MTNERDYDAVLWDMDGTLADSEPLHLRSLLEVLEHHGVTAGDELHPLTLGLTGREVHTLCCERFGLTTAFDDWAAFRAQRYLAGAPSLMARQGALPVWHAAQRAGLAQAVVSNSSRMLLQANLRALGLETPQLVSISANDVRRGKPDPEPWLRAAWLLQVPPARAIVVEDSPTGARAALAAGMRVIAWPEGETPVSAFPVGARIVRSAEALAACLALPV